MKKYLWVLFFFFHVPLSLWAEESSLYYRDALDEYLGAHYSRAAVDLQLAIRGNSGNWKTHQLLGYCYYQMKDEVAALAECQVSLGQYGDNTRLRDFVEWLKSSPPRPMRSNQQAVLEGPEEAEMPPPPDIVAKKKPAAGPAQPDPFLDVLGHFRFQLGPGMNIIGEGFNPNSPALGQGGEFALGYAFDDRWSLWLGMEFYDLPGNNAPNIFQSTFPASLYQGLFLLRYGFGGSLLRPYVTAGFGWMTTDASGFYFFNTRDYYPLYDLAFPVAQGKLGLECPLDPGVSLFLESGANVVFVTLSEPYNVTPAQTTHLTAMDYPINLGIILDLWNGQGRGPSPAPPNGGFFVKAGGGLALDPGSYGGSNESPAFGTLCGAFGYDFPDGVSVFADVERFPQEWAVLANIQYTISTTTMVEPYLYGGLGADLPNSGVDNPAGVALQLALGLQFRADRTFSLYTELRDYASVYYDPYLNNLLGNTLLEAGLKVVFPDVPAPAKVGP